MKNAQLTFTPALCDNLYTHLTQRFDMSEIEEKNLDSTTFVYKNIKYYLFDSKLETQMEENDIDFKFYDIKNPENLKHLTKLISAFLN